MVFFDFDFDFDFDLKAKKATQWIAFNDKSQK